MPLCSHGNEQALCKVEHGVRGTGAFDKEVGKAAVEAWLSREPAAS